MAKLPTINRISREDLREAPSWIEKMITPLNLFMETVWAALNKNITFSDNIACQLKSVTFTTSSTYTTGDFSPINFTTSLKTKPIGVVILQLQASSGVVVTNSVSISWSSANNGTVDLDFISGLDDSTEYTVSLLII